MRWCWGCSHRLIEPNSKLTPRSHPCYTLINPRKGACMVAIFFPPASPIFDSRHATATAASSPRRPQSQARREKHPQLVYFPMPAAPPARHPPRPRRAHSFRKRKRRPTVLAPPCLLSLPLPRWGCMNAHHSLTHAQCPRYRPKKPVTLLKK